MAGLSQGGPSGDPAVGRAEACREQWGGQEHNMETWLHCKARQLYLYSTIQPPGNSNVLCKSMEINYK